MASSHASGSRSSRGGDALFVGFNQDGTCVAVGTRDAHDVYSTGPPVRRCYAGPGGGASVVGMLHRTSLLAVVAVGSPRRVELRNTADGTAVCNLSFPDPVLAVRMNKRRLVVVLERCLHLFDVEGVSPLQVIDTERNERGLCALSVGEDASVVAFPRAVDPGCGDVMVVDAAEARYAQVVRAHRGPLAALALSGCGTKLATACTKGTVIRVFGVGVERRSSTSDARGGDAPLLHTLRRGAKECTIHSIAFGHAADLVAVSGSSATVHVWRCAGARQGAEEAAEPVKSWAQAKVRESPQPSSVALSADSKRVMVAWRDGRLNVYLLDHGRGGQCKLESEHRLRGD